MDDIQKILIPTDLSAGSIAGLEYGVTLAKLYTSKLYLLHVMDNSPYEVLSRTCSVMDELYNSVEKNVFSELKQFIADTDKKDIDEVLSLVRCGLPEREIVKFAESEKVNLIVMTEKRIIYGTDKETVTKKVIRISNIPVVTIRSGVLGERQSYLGLIKTEQKKKGLNGTIPA